jgi:hypothetical protein
MHPEISKLVTMLDEAAAIFRIHSMNHWASWLEKDIQHLRNSDFYGIRHLLSAYGGMGSLNDVGLAEPDPLLPGVLRIHSDDARLQNLIAEMHALASKLSREESEK